MTATVHTQITCPGCHEELSVKARFFKAPTDSDGEHSVDILLDLDQASWFEAHSDTNCETLPPAEPVKGKPWTPPTKKP